MLSDQIISTLRFFDLQNLPLTSFEVHKFLIGGRESSLDDVAKTLETLVASSQAAQTLGFYCLPERQNLVRQHLRNYLHGLQRERLVKRYASTFRHLPFIRGVALAGSQSLGEQKRGSDIDLLIITHPQFLWTARIFITGYLQVLGLRRHGRRIANRFCLNHYIAGPKQISESKNLYTAMEYLKLRPLVSPQSIRDFQENNISWIAGLFPNAAQHLAGAVREPGSRLQKIMEFILDSVAGRFLESRLGDMQLKRIRISKDILVRKDELSFHPDSKQAGLLERFYR